MTMPLVLASLFPALPTSLLRASGAGNIKQGLYLNVSQTRYSATAFSLRIKGNSSIGTEVSDDDLATASRPIPPKLGQIARPLINGDLPIPRCPDRRELRAWNVERGTIAYCVNDFDLTRPL